MWAWAAKHFRAYLLGHDCTVFTDHAPLKVILKAKHQTGKLARWEAVISELNLNIRYHPERKNSNADVLSHSPLEVGVDDSESEANHSVLQVATDGSPVTDVPRETDEISRFQSKDDELHLVRQYLKDGALLSDEKRARKILLQKDQFVLLEDVLYHIYSSPQHRLRIVIPYEMTPVDGREPLQSIWRPLCREGSLQDVDIAPLVGGHVSRCSPSLSGLPSLCCLPRIGS